jgi:ferredoxin
LFWNEAESKIEHDESKCTGCGACVDACPVRAIMLANDINEAQKIKNAIDEDPRKEANLFVDRYGADITITQPTNIKVALENIKKISRPVVLELYEDASLRCLANSIPIAELVDSDYKYVKSEADDDTRNLLNIAELPALIFFKNGGQIGKVEGYFEDNSGEREVLIGKVRKIIDE